ncbi:hypothetical protein F5I97DRAFT_1966205 [Phlebopus sp. FC_14]|nr:hypothetical protein F5I97DRAFT_1966205 [Phlebopus sp. FC_14]
MSLVLPPPGPARNRASSTNVRPALTINTLGRRRSSSLVLPPSPAPSPPSSSPAPSMLAVIASTCLGLLRVPNHPISSTPSSPLSTVEDDLVLPLSASSQQTSFSDKNEKDLSPLRRRWPRISFSVHTPYLTCPDQVRAPIVFVILLFPLSTALVFLSLYSLPISVAWPRTLSELAMLGQQLQMYSQSGPAPLAHVIGVLSVAAVWKHAWSIPGSVIWNVLAGALFHPLLATLLLSTLTTIGSVFATLLCMPLAPFLSRIFPRALEITRSGLEGESDLTAGPAPKSPAWVRLSILRLIGVVPWSGINIACGVCGVALSDCLLGAFIGCLPWTAVTCQIGDILQTVASAPSPGHQTVSSLLASPETIFKLIFLSFLSLAPILGRERLRALLSRAPSSTSEGQERPSRWDWMHNLQTKMKMPSRSRSGHDAM